MPRQALALPPGIKRQATSQASKGTWWDASLVRWRQGQMQPVGGWLQLPSLQLNGPVRTILSWRDNAAERWVAAASLAQIQVWDTTGHVISPADFQSGNPADLIDGWGIGNYSDGDYGTPRIPDVVFNPRAGPGDTVTLDNWGQDLLAMGSADGRLLHWVPDASVSTILAPVAGAPVGRTFIVTNERSVVVIGADNDPRRVSWCDLEDLTDWTPTISNLAGSLQLKTTGRAIAARRVPQGVLIFCDDDVHLLSFTGAPYAYGLQKVGEGCGPIGPQAICSMLGRTAWMGQQGFWAWDGVPRPMPLDVTDYVFRMINRQTQGRTVCAHNGEFPELWWFWPDESSTEPNRYVAWNYADNITQIGHLARTGVTEPGAYGLPLMGDVNGYVYEHEQGWTDNGNPRFSQIYAETGDIQLGEGDQAVCVRSIIPDVALNPTNIQYHVFGQWEPEDVLEDYGVYPYERSDGVVDALFEARAIRMRIEATADGPWELGRMRLDMVPGAGR
jgi:hypothetical protein